MLETLERSLIILTQVCHVVYSNPQICIDGESAIIESLKHVLNIDRKISSKYIALRKAVGGNIAAMVYIPDNLPCRICDSTGT